MSAKYKYDIRIMFSSTKNHPIGNFEVEYPFSNNSAFKDKFVIKEKSIKIICLRTRGYSASEIIHNVNSSINQQISKSLAYYYAAVGEPNKISSIKIDRYLGDNLQESKTYKKTEIRQIVTIGGNGFCFLKKIDRLQLEAILQETSSGRSLLYAVTHLINSCSSPEPFQQFESLWKSFNSIYKLKENSISDAICLMNLRAHMLENVANYPLSTDLVDLMEHDDIFNIINWRNMILNDYDTESKSQSLCDFIKRISDSRVIKKIEDSLSIRKKFLTNKNLINDVVGHISNMKLSSKKSNIEVVALICLKYLYYTRNKLIHAERVHPSFYWANKNTNEEVKIISCSKVLKLLVVDLLNFSSKF